MRRSMKRPCGWTGDIINICMTAFQRRSPAKRCWRSPLDLAEINRVLRTGGLLIAPNFVEHGTGIFSRICSKLLRLAGIHFEHQWTESEYLHWLQTHGWDVTFSKLLPSRIPLLYTECVRSYKIRI